MISFVNDRSGFTTPMSIFYLIAIVILFLISSLMGCMMPQKALTIKENEMQLTEDAIYRSDTASVVPREEMFHDLAQFRIIYVGEQHTNPSHHANQLAVIKAIFENDPKLTIGMEMFDHTYQQVLDQWIAGGLDETAFLEKSHWYANWRFDFDLYRGILEYAKENRIRIVALNLPFHIPGKISTGGIASLQKEDRRHLPKTVNLDDAEHRAYVEKIFSMHALPGRENFEHFYEAQCVWEDAMAEAVAENLSAGKMVVIIGNGHIIRKFGVPNRVFSRNHLPFRTIYMEPVGNEIDADDGDYIWVTPKTPMPRMPMR